MASLSKKANGTELSVLGAKCAFFISCAFPLEAGELRHRRSGMQVRRFSTASIEPIHVKTKAEKEFDDIKRLTSKLGLISIPTLLESKIEAVSSVRTVAVNFKFVVDQFMIRAWDGTVFSAGLGSRNLYLEDFSMRRRDFIRHLDNKLDEIKASIDKDESVDPKEKQDIVKGIADILTYVRMASELLDMGTNQIDKLINKVAKSGLIILEKDGTISPVASPYSTAIEEHITPFSIRC